MVTNAGFFFLHGLYIGSVLELLTIRYGIQGILMYVAFVMPQGIFYILGYLILGCWCLGMEKNTKGEQKNKRDKVYQFADKGRLMTAFLFIFIGIIMESYVNLIILKRIF